MSATSLALGVKPNIKTKVAPIIKWAEDSLPFELTSLLEFIGDLLLFRAIPYAPPILFRKNRRSNERSEQQ